ncbi:CL17A-like protein [Mya arenaria]|uniref:CL17A-like protein n=1 Tax=Mya arenaria TaxID=6604 RepID=A0ABY7DU95_MYAAR|nr:CL17A-like protein [Mya arenaria]
MYYSTARHWWIGLTDKVVDGEWLWGDGSETTFTDWHTNEPNGDGECGHLHYGADYAWNDLIRRDVFNSYRKKRPQANTDDIIHDQDNAHALKSRRYTDDN